MRVVPGHLVRACVAGVLAIGLLGGGAGTYAAWSDTETHAGRVAAGELGLDAGSTTIAVIRPSADGSAPATLPGDAPLVAGDTLRITTEVTVRARGTSLAATLLLDLDGLFGTQAPELAEVLRRDLVVDVEMRGPSGSVRQAPAGGPWSVTEADHGATVTATIETTLPATAPDGAAWGTALQGRSTAGAVRWSLTQEA
ncbi:TasA family protein [Georgenia subflava]|uniref:Alternate-type signal peptide domain-containing protein n=1 Tax=Georgenia subflava TaxID=1622177 RepID=A0A6N7EIK5_9MICO|nr:TasA family protein [Georgenia subflava]MPV37979.1 hypothetical protein [Georgenia subflava]